MKSIDFSSVKLNSGYWFDKAELNRKITVNSVYNRFNETGRIKAFDCNWRENEENKPHIFWDSDVAKWIEGAAYILAQHSDTVLESRIDALIEKIRIHQSSDGYFNTYFTAVEPAKRFLNRDNHELYCAGHLIEAAIACDKIGKPVLIECMKKYVSYIRDVFMIKRSAAFATPGHEEIELALIRLYRHTGNKDYLDLAAFFINTRGTDEDFCRDEFNNAYFQSEHAVYNQSHLPVREQNEAVGHAVRALYLYTAMAMLAAETDDSALFNTCRNLFDDITSKKMYITGAVGSTCHGEAFTVPYDLPSDTAYAETCASIALMFFCRAMSENVPDSRYADVIERVFYNCVLSGLSADGKSFFYTNPLEINLSEHFRENKNWLPGTKRSAVFDCSCCPPNINRLLASLGGFIFSVSGGTLYIHQYTSCEMHEGNISCTVKTDYPVSGKIEITASGTERLALRIPFWCENFTVDKPHKTENGYIIIESNCVKLNLEILPRAIFANENVLRDACRVAVMCGPVVYCAESTDISVPLHRICIPPEFAYSLKSGRSGLPHICISAYALKSGTALYSYLKPEKVPVSINLIPYSYFANRGECDMRVWFNALP